MKTTRIAPHLTQLTQLGLMNAFLVAEDDGLTLIDTCLGQAKPIAAAVAASGRPLRRITLTHGHTDHAGSLDALMDLFPEAELSVHAREARFLAGDHSLDPDELPRKLPGGFVKLRHAPQRVLKEGDRVGSLQVLFTPGHSPGHVAFLDERDGTVIAGDTFTAVGGLAVSGDLKLVFPFATLATWSFPHNLASAERLAALKPARLCFGHGRSIPDPVPQMRAALDRAADKLHSKLGA